MNKYSLAILFLVFSFTSMGQVVTGGGPSSSEQEFFKANESLGASFRLCYNEKADIRNIRDVYLLLKISDISKVLGKSSPKVESCPEASCVRTQAFKDALENFLSMTNVDDYMKGHYGISDKQVDQLRKDFELWTKEKK